MKNYYNFHIICNDYIFSIAENQYYENNFLFYKVKVRKMIILNSYLNIHVT